MLGADYAGYFAVGTTEELAYLMRRCEMDAPYYARLHKQCAGRAHLFHPDREVEAWRAVLESVGITVR